eukprot:scaffold2974_cov404-Prasinococcus_capsulatus_cf.AAC.4
MAFAQRVGCWGDIEKPDEPFVDALGYLGAVDFQAQNRPLGILDSAFMLHWSGTNKPWKDSFAADPTLQEPWLRIARKLHVLSSGVSPFASVKERTAATEAVLTEGATESSQMAREAPQPNSMPRRHQYIILAASAEHIYLNQILRKIQQEHSEQIAIVGSAGDAVVSSERFPNSLFNDQRM